MLPGTANHEVTGFSPDRMPSCIEALHSARLGNRLEIPVTYLEYLGAASVLIHRDLDQAVPLEANSGEMRKRYAALGGKMQLIIPPGQGHNMWEGFFQCQELVDFVLERALQTNATVMPGR